MKLKGIVLAGGTGSRLMPLTKVTNKHLLPVGQKPMIYYPVEKLTSVGIEQILVVTGVEHMGDVVGLLGSGSEFGCQFTYKVQDEAGGIAQALSLAEDFAKGQSVAVILGARVLLKEVPDPHRFGVAEIAGDKVVSIEEKPKQPKSNYAITGIYFYDAAVYDIIRALRPSARGELEITDVNNGYIAKEQLGYDILEGWWTDAGTFASLGRAGELLMKEPPQ